MLLDREEASLRRTRAQLPPDVPLVVLLDFPRREAVITAMRLGATAVLGKPWRVDQLLAALQPGFTNASVGGQEVAEHDLGDHQ